MTRPLFTFICSLFCALAGAAPVPYVINAYNGLPSNHAYSTIVDNYGYLWVCTSKGLAKYNGYEMQVFNVSNGLPGNDIWGLYLDRKNRLWIQCIANSIGYLRNDKFVQATVADKHTQFYPVTITDYGDGIMFLTSGEFTGTKGQSRYDRLTYERNDSIFYTQSVSKISRINDWNDVASIDREKKMITAYEFDGKKLNPIKKCYKEYVARPSYAMGMYFNHYLISPLNGSNSFTVIDLFNGEEKTVVFLDSNGASDPIVFQFGHKHKMYIVTNDFIYGFDETLKQTDRISLEGLGMKNTPSGSKNITYYIEDPMWGKVISTNTNGIYIANFEPVHFSRINTPDMSDYSFLGQRKDSITFWWNNNTNSLIALDKSGVHTMLRDDWLHNARTIVEVAGNETILVKDNKVKWFARGSDILPSDTNTLYSFGDAFKSIIRFGDYYYMGGRQGIVKLKFQQGTFKEILHYWDGATHIAADKVRNGIWGYNNGLIAFHSERNKEVIIDNPQLRKLGIDYVEKICVDTLWGNILLNDGRDIIYIDPVRHERRKLFGRYNLANAQLSVNGNLVVCAGKFGILFSRISGVGIFEQPVVFTNSKGQLYHHLKELAVLDDRAMLNTDKGMFAVAIPEPAAQNRQEPYRSLVKYKDSIFSITNDLTLMLDQKDRVIHMDVINPAGWGKLAYKYYVAGSDHSWHETKSNEIFLPGLLPGKEYRLHVRAYDEVWVSSDILLNIYVVPYWWQQSAWKNALWITVVLAILLFGYFIMWFTRKKVMHNNERKNEMLELELKAIYAQLNPHFIFNTLNVALYFIRKKAINEAYSHVSKFSTLLRAYLESSKNRDIALSNEISNLKNYIELQQARFDDAFTFDIILTNIPHPDIIYIPSLLLQPLVENAINHGLLPKESGGYLKIEFEMSEKSGTITCRIEDNGIGRERSAELNRENNFRKGSQGNDLLKKLVETLNKYQRQGINIEYTDKKHPETGTIITININNPRNERL